MVFMRLADGFEPANAINEIGCTKRKQPNN